ncbi:MAG: hypothetical protein ACR2G9_04825 [Gaiellaceae bacterium]
MELLPIPAVLICPLVLGGTMVWMMRQMRGGNRGGDRPREDGPG